MGRGRARLKAGWDDGPDDGLAGVTEPVTPRPTDLSGAGRALVADDRLEDRGRPSQSGTGTHRGGGRLRAMTQSVNDAPDPDSDEFLQEQNTVERVSPGTTADAPATEAELISTDPGSSQDAPAS